MTIGRQSVVSDEVKKAVENVSFVNEIGAKLYLTHRYEEAEYHFTLVLCDLNRARICFNNSEIIKSFKNKHQENADEQQEHQSYAETSRSSSRSSSRRSSQNGSRRRLRRGSSTQTSIADTYTLLNDPDEPTEIFPLDVEDEFDEFDDKTLGTMTSHWLCSVTIAVVHNLVLSALAQGHYKEAQGMLEKALSQWQNEIRHGALHSRLKTAFLNDATSVAQLVALYYLSGRVMDDMALAKKQMPSEKDCQTTNQILYRGAIQQYERALQVGDSLMKRHVSARQWTLLSTYRWLAEACKKEQNEMKTAEAYRRAVKAFILPSEEEDEPHSFK